jgi:tetratricopeptide (TPR) repeat protein
VLRSETQVTQGFESYRGAESPGVTLKVVKYTRGKIREDTRQQRIAADITAKGIEFIRKNRDQKFFLWLHYFDAHNPYSPPAPFAGQFRGDPYHGEVASADSQIGRVIEELDRLGLRGRTLVVLTSDHGEGLGEHGEPSHSYFVYETTMRVPLIIAGLGLPASLRIPALVRTADVAPTVLDLMNLPPLDDIQGVSLGPLLRGEKADLELTAYSEATRFKATFGMPTLRTVRHGRWKYIHQVNPQLFDVVADPSERSNVADAHPEVVAEMRARLETMLTDAPAGPSDAEAAVDARTAAQLVALGYVAKSPSFSIGDEVSDLELRGHDPDTLLEDIQTVSNLGGLMKRREYEMAMEKLLFLRERNPKSTFVLGMYADCLDGLGRYAEAIAARREILAVEPGNRDVAYGLARSLKDNGQGNEAADLLNELLADDPCDERVRLDQNEFLRELGRLAELMGVLEEGVERCPEILSNSNNLAWALATMPDEDHRDGARALEMIRSVIARAPEPNPAHLDTLAAALAETGDFDGAVREVEKVIDQLRRANLPEEIIEQVQGHLDAYQQAEPVRDPSPTAS